MNLRFNNPVFHDGINVTVRRGTKWSGAEKNQPEFGCYVYSTTFELDDNGNEKMLGFAEILYTRVFRFCDLANVNLEFEHDPSCRDYEGLRRAIQNTYPNFSEFEMVTLIHFNFHAAEGV